MTIFSVGRHDTNRAHPLSEISLLMHCIQIVHPWTIPVIVTGAALSTECHATGASM